MCIKKSPCFGFFTLVKYVLKVCMYEGFLNFTDICCNVYSIISNFINLDILFCLVWLRIVDLGYLFKDPICFSLIFLLFVCLHFANFCPDLIISDYYHGFGLFWFSNSLWKIIPFLFKITSITFFNWLIAGHGDTHF